MVVISPKRAIEASLAENEMRTPNKAGVNSDIRIDRPPSRTAAAHALFAGAIAILGWLALATDLAQFLQRGLAQGWGVALTLFLFFRFFTILANVALAALMSVSAVAFWRGQSLPSASRFRAVLVYMIVTGATYELLLRRLWSPQGLQFCTDLAFHDIQPAAALIFWIVAAPKRDLRWGDLPRLLAFPVVYFAITLVVGALGGGYPYDFLDADRLGYPAVLAIGMVFLGVFLILGALVTIAGRTLTDDRSATVSRRSSS